MTLISDINQLAADVVLVHSWVQGGSGTTVVMGGVPVRSPAKLIADWDASINAAANGFLVQTATNAASAESSATASAGSAAAAAVSAAASSSANCVQFAITQTLTSGQQSTARSNIAAAAAAGSSTQTFSTASLSVTGPSTGANDVAATVSKSATNGNGSVILRVCPIGTANATDIESNSGSGAGYRFGTIYDTTISNQYAGTVGVWGNLNLATGGAIRFTVQGGSGAGNNYNYGTLTCSGKITGQNGLQINGATNTWNAAVSTALVGKDATTGRSINASGTINASGADYAEYEKKSLSCGTIVPGQIVGFDSQGCVTDKFSQSISFAIKSTNPNLVGGDVWGSEAALGMAQPIAPNEPPPPIQPIQPEVVADPGAPPDPITQEWIEASSAYTTYLSALEKHAADEVAYQAALEKHTVDVTAYQAELAVYNAEEVAFLAALEAARQTVDRIAYCGKVPVNVIGATAGDYIFPVASASDVIIGQVVKSSDITFAQSLAAVGRVRRILPDGRAEVAVIIH